MWATLGIAVVAVSVTSLFYNVFRTDWPQHYFSAEDLTAFTTSRTWTSWLVFRCAPPMIVCAIARITTERLDGHPLFGVCLYILLYLSTSAGRTLAVQLVARTRSETTNRRPSLAVAFGSVVLVAVSSVIGYVLGQQLSSVVPSPSNLLTTLFTATLAGLIGAHLNNRGGTVDFAAALQREEQRLGLETLSKIDESAIESGIDRDLVRAIIITECLQRPRWFRGLENLASKLGVRVTRGIAQNLVGKGSDEQSIERLTETLRGVALPAFPPRAAVEAALERHNGSTAFLRMAWEIYATLSTRVLARSEEVDTSSLPLLEVSECVRSGGNWVLAGTCSMDVLSIEAAEYGGAIVSQATMHQPSKNRRRFGLLIPVQYSYVALKAALQGRHSPVEATIGFS